jgi:hypothetical protein
LKPYVCYRGDGQILCRERGDHFGVNVLVSQEWEVERLHAGLATSRTTIPLSHHPKMRLALCDPRMLLGVSLFLAASVLPILCIIGGAARPPLPTSLRFTLGFGVLPSPPFRFG